MKMTITNKPCPFCGETKYLKQEGDTVICDTCFGGDWNSRPIEDGLRAEIEALQKQVDDTTFMFLERHEAVDELVALGYQFVRAIKDTDRNDAFVEALNKWNEAVKRIRKKRE